MNSPAEKLPSTRDPELWKIAVFTCLSTTFVFIAFTALFLAMAFNLHSQHCQQLMERFSDIEQRAVGWRWFGSGIVMPIFEVIALTLFVKKALSQRGLLSTDKG